jgi:hypothetical protein
MNYLHVTVEGPSSNAGALQVGEASAKTKIHCCRAKPNWALSHIRGMDSAGHFAR